MLTGATTVNVVRTGADADMVAEGFVDDTALLDDAHPVTTPNHTACHRPSHFRLRGPRRRPMTAFCTTSSERSTADLRTRSEATSGSSGAVASVVGVADGNRSVYRWWFIMVLRGGAVLFSMSVAAAFVVEKSTVAAVALVMLGTTGAARALAMKLTIDDANVSVRNFFSTRTFALGEVRGFGTHDSLLQFPWTKVTVRVGQGRFVKMTAGSMTWWLEDRGAARLTAMAEDLRRRQSTTHIGKRRTR